MVCLLSKRFLDISTALAARSYSSNIQVDTLHKIKITREENRNASKHWAAPSDHLPLFGRVDGLRIVTWNILNHLYVGHLEMSEWVNSVLVKKCRTASEKYPGYTLQEEESLGTLMRVLKEDPSADVACIQECSDRFYRLLMEHLEPKGVDIVLGDGKRGNHVATLVNRDQCTIQKDQVKIVPIFQREIQGKMLLDQWRPAVDLVLEPKFSYSIPEKIRVINLHISSAGRSDLYKKQRVVEVQKYIKASFSEKIPVAACGDFNACKSLSDPILKDAVITSLCSHYTQIENIVTTNEIEKEEEPHLVSIDELLWQIARPTRFYHEAHSIPLEETSDHLSAKTLKTVIDPLVSVHRGPQTP